MSERVYTSGETQFAEVCNECRAPKEWVKVGHGKTKATALICKACEPMPEPKRALSPAGARRKGKRLETAQRKKFEGLGLAKARVQPGSGAFGTQIGDESLTGDVSFTIGGRQFRNECKARANGDGFKTLSGWIKGCQILTLKADREPPMHVLTDEAFTWLLARANTGEGR